MFSLRGRAGNRYVSALCNNAGIRGFQPYVHRPLNRRQLSMRCRLGMHHKHDTCQLCSVANRSGNIPHILIYNRIVQCAPQITYITFQSIFNFCKQKALPCVFFFNYMGQLFFVCLRTNKEYNLLF